MKGRPAKKRPKWVVWLFLITVPIMGAQFIYASVIHKTFPGFTMPSFATQEIAADSLLRSTQHKVAGITCSGDTIHFTMETIFSGVSPIGARQIIDRVFFYTSLEERLTPQRKAYYNKIERYTSPALVDYILRIRYPDVEPEDVMALDFWLQERIRQLDSLHSFCGAVVIRYQEVRHLVTQNVVRSKFLDQYQLQYE